MPQLSELVIELKAAGEITRLRLLALLSLGELSVKDFTQILKQSQPRISRHLRLLTDSGLVVRHAQGAWAYFSISSNSEKSRLVYSLLDGLDLWDAQLKADREQLKILRQEQREKASKYFSKIAHEWDLLRTMYISEKLIEGEIVAFVGTDKRKTMLDLGTGTGRMIELLSGNFERAIAIDSSKEMINIARAKLAEAGIVNAQIRIGDILKLAEYENVADFAIMHQVLHYFDDPAHVLLVAKQTLKSGGEMLIVDFAPHEHEFLALEHQHRRLGISLEQMKNWASKAGLKIIKFKEIQNEKDTSDLSVCLWLLKDFS